MTSQPLQNVSIVWRVPDPRDERAPYGQSVNLFWDELTWKAVGRSWRTDESWDAVLTSPLRKKVSALLESLTQDEASSAVVQQAVERLREQVEQGFRRPLVLIRQYGKYPWWTIVLPCGAVARVLCHKGAWLRNCHFLDGICVSQEWEGGWKAVVKRLVWRNGYVSPDGRQLFPKRETEDSGIIKFVTLRTWGFAEEIRGNPWRGRLGTWQHPDAEVPRTRFQLQKRKSD